jgi:Rrf2 family protein
MKLSTKVRYGARAMTDLALVNRERALSVKEMAENQRLSVKYLEQIMAALKAAGLVRVSRGQQGGYTLAKPTNKIRLLDVYQALDGALVLVECIEDPAICDMKETCPTTGLWKEMNVALKRVLEKTTIRDLAQRKKKLIN